MALLDNITFSPIKDGHQQPHDDPRNKFKIPGISHAYNAPDTPKSQAHQYDSVAAVGSNQGFVQIDHRGHPLNPYMTPSTPQSAPTGPISGPNLLPDALPLMMAIPSPGSSPQHPGHMHSAPGTPHSNSPPLDNPFFALSGVSGPPSPYGMSPPGATSFGGFSNHVAHTQGMMMPQQMWAIGQGMQHMEGPPIYPSSPMNEHVPMPQQIPLFRPDPSHPAPQSVGAHPHLHNQAFHFQGGSPTASPKWTMSHLQGLFGKHMNSRQVLQPNGVQAAVAELQHLTGAPRIDSNYILGLIPQFDYNRDGCLTFQEFTGLIQFLRL